jgi:thioesterase domain-containing protein
VASLAARLRETETEAEPAGASPLVLLQPGGPRLPLFLIHPAGGQVLCYAELARHLGPDQPVYGLEDVSGSARSISDLAAVYIQAVQSLQAEGPYRLAGWSFGGRVAFEMARQLAAQGREVAFLGMIDTGRATPDEEPDLSELGLLREILPDASRQILDELPESARRFWQAFRRHVEMARRESPLPWPGRLTFFIADDDPGEDPTHGWGALAAAVEVHRIPGDHVSMVYDAANLEVLARHLREAVHFPPS